MRQFGEVVLGRGVVAVTACLSFAGIVLLYRLCCHSGARRRLLRTSTSVSRDDADRMLLVQSTPRSDVKQLKRSAVKTQSRGLGLYEGVKALRSGCARLNEKRRL